MIPAPSSPDPRAPFAVVGRYAIFDEIAAGGMATVHLGRLLGAAGFSRTVAIKRLHGQFSRDPEFAEMFMDEARLAARIAHPNVVQTIDVVPDDKELLLVMEYVHGVPFATLLGAARRTGQRVPPRIIAGVMVGVLGAPVGVPITLAFASAEGLSLAEAARLPAGDGYRIEHPPPAPRIHLPRATRVKIRNVQNPKRRLGHERVLGVR